jgi:hypothetical protein
MSKFIGELIVEPLPDGKFWRVHEQFEYHSDLLGETIKIPKGFLTDGASIPKLFWNIIQPTGPYFRSAVIHDYLYRWQKFTRKQSDDTFLEGMWVLGCKRWQYVCIYTAVRLFGHWAWKEDAKKPLTMVDLKLNRA